MANAARKPRRVSFDNEKAVLKEIAKEIEYKPSELEIEESSNYSGFGVPIYMITTVGYGGKGGTKEWYVVQDSDAEEELALAIVKQDLESEPGIFTQSFIESHIDTDQLRTDLYSDVLNMTQDDLQEMNGREFWREAERHGMDRPEDEDGNETDEYDDSQVEELAGLITDERLKDPMQYLEDIYGREEAVEQAIRIAGIDVEAAAQEAVNVDGAAHFLSSYDGSTNESPSGFVWWRGN